MRMFKRLKLAFSNTAFEDYKKAFVSGEDTIPDHSGAIDETTALKYSAFFGCARVLAETFASASISEYKRVGKGANASDKEKTDDTGVYPILKYGPNDETSAYNFFESMMYQIILGGTFYAERIFNGRRLEGLLQVDYNKIKLRRNESTRKLQYDIALDTGVISKTSGEMLRIPGPSVNGITGMSALSYGAGAVRLGLTYEQFGQQFFKNGALSSGVFKHPQFLKEEAYNRLVKKIKNDWRGLTNAGKPILAEDGLDFSPLSINPIDAELLTSKYFQVEDICRFLRVPPHLVQHLERSTNNNIEHQSLEFIMYTMLPNFKRCECNLNFQLLSPQQRAKGYFLEFNIASLMRGDQKSMAEAFAKGRQWGWLSINDIRRMLNLNSVPGGDSYLQPLNMVDINDPAESSIAPGGKVTTEIERLFERV